MFNRVCPSGTPINITIIMEKSFVFCVSLGFDKHRCSSWEKALKKGQEMQSPLTKVAIQPLDIDDPNRVAVFDITTFQALCLSKNIHVILKDLTD